MPLQESPESVAKRKNLKEKLFLANQASSAGLKVLPSDKWALHYKTDGAQRAEKLYGLLSGNLDPAEVSEDLRPDAILYDSSELESEGMESISDRIRDISGMVGNYDYHRFAEFVSKMKGRTEDVELVQSLYDGVTKSRIRKKLLDAYGSTGRRQMESSMRMEARRTIKNFRDLDSIRRVMEALKLNWMAEDLNLIDDVENVISDLSEDEAKIFEKLKSAYGEFAQNGSENSYKELVDFIREQMPQIEKTQNEQSESMQELQEELEKYEDQVGPPGTEDDPAIPFEDKDEYHTPPPQPGASEGGGEKMKNPPIFEIEAAGKSKKPMAGDYCSGRKSYYDQNTKTWSKKKVVSEYSDVLKGDERQKISRNSPGGMESIPIPAGYALDMSSLKYTGSKPKILRDQTGCFYAEVSGPSNFSVEFLKEEPPVSRKPISEDLHNLYSGHLSAPTEAKISSLKGNALEKAIQARDYIHAKHYYPGGGDLNAAQALQYKLRTESTGADYIQNLDASAYLECYSSNSLFIAMLRKAGIPARLVIGHKIDSAKNGKCVIDNTTGHAWSEIWDGTAWRRLDATPVPKPQDKKKEGEKGEKSTPTEKADDGGVDKNEVQDEVEDSVQEIMEDFKDAAPGEASDQETC